VFDPRSLGFPDAPLSTDCLRTFSNPFDPGFLESDAMPEFVIPEIYLCKNPILKGSHIGKFSLQTLFYIFYSMTNEFHQAIAAEDLYKRNWRYDCE
jgi:CCR4-NOT transcription complex subunit 2